MNVVLCRVVAAMSCRCLLQPEMGSLVRVKATCRVFNALNMDYAPGASLSVLVCLIGAPKRIY